MVGRILRNESGNTIIQTAIAIILMIVTFLATVSVGLVWFSTTALEAEIAEAVTRSDLSAIAASGNPDEAFEEQILANSAGLVADNLDVDGCEVTALTPIEETVPAREVAGSSATAVTRVRDVVRIEADVRYLVPSPLFLGSFGEHVLEQHVEAEQTVETRIEVS